MIMNVGLAGSGSGGNSWQLLKNAEFDITGINNSGSSTGISGMGTYAESSLYTATSGEDALFKSYDELVLKIVVDSCSFTVPTPSATNSYSIIYINVMNTVSNWAIGRMYTSNTTPYDESATSCPLVFWKNKNATGTLTVNNVAHRSFYSRETRAYSNDTSPTGVIFNVLSLGPNTNTMQWVAAVTTNSTPISLGYTARNVSDGSLKGRIQVYGRMFDV